jgi:hypothetical protein
VGGDEWIEVVVGQLEPWDHQQVVLAPRPLRLRLDLREVSLERGVAEPGQHRVRRLPRVVASNDVIRDRQHVEAAPTLEVDELGKRQLAVAPLCVRVELAEQRLDSPAHRCQRA